MSTRLPCAVLQLRADGEIVCADEELARLLGSAQPPASGCLFGEFLTAGSRVLWELQVLPAFAIRPRIDEILLRLRGDAGEVPVLVNASIDRERSEPRITLVIVQMQRREVWENEIQDARKRATELAQKLHARTEELEAAKQRLEESIAETAASHWLLERVADVLPVCMECGDVREGRKWGSVLDFLKRNARFLSHGYCPKCEHRVWEREGLVR